MSNVLPDYRSVLELDKAVRDFPLPGALKDPTLRRPKTTRSLVMQRAIVATNCEIGVIRCLAWNVCAHPSYLALLHLHHNYFAKFLSLPRRSTPIGEYVPSILATFSSACRLIATLETFYSQEPLLCSRFVRFWSNAAFSAVCRIHLPILEHLLNL